MTNMSYCRFRNTLEDLRDCYEHWELGYDPDEDEVIAQKKLLELCIDVVQDYGDLEEDD